MTKLKGLAFDLDGTLFNSTSVSCEALQEGFEAFWAELGEEGPTPSWETAKRLIGLPSRDFYPAVLPESHRERWPLLHRLVADSEIQRLEQGGGRTFPGVHETLREIGERGYLLECLSNASKRYFDAVLDACNLRRYFTKLCWLGVSPTRGKADVLREWSSELGGPETLIYVGDRGGDVEAAHAAGLEVVGVTYGYGAREELAQADAIIDELPELLELIAVREERGSVRRASEKP